MRIVLAVDGSERSIEAARTLHHLAPAEALIVVHAVDVPRLAYPATTPGLQKEFAIKVEQAMKEAGSRLLDEVATLVGSSCGPITKRIDHGSPADVILSEVEKHRAHLLILGSRGLGEVGELFLGSVSHRLTTHAPCSIFVVKKAMPQLTHVLLPVESREDAEAAVAFLASKPFRHHVKVTVLHVLPFGETAWPAGTTLPEELRSDMLVEAEKVANEIAAALPSPAYKATGKVSMGIPAATILEEAATAAPDLILMRSKIRTAASRFFLGSVSHAVVHRSTCSVLLIR